MNEPDFKRHAQAEFSFLVASCGFTETTAESSLVKYDSADVMVEVNYSGRGEVDVIIDENPSSNRFQFRLFLKAFHPAVEKAMGFGIANSDDQVRRELKALSELLRRYGKPLLEHDRQVFDRMKTFKWWEAPS